MQNGFTKNLALILTLVLGASFLAYAQLGGGSGVIFPYAGYLERNGTPMNETIDVTVEVYSQSAGGPTCDTDVVSDVLVSGGNFSISVGPIAEACVLNESVYLEVLVEGAADAAPVRLNGRTQVRPAVAAYTGAAGGDFDVPDQLSAGSVFTSSVDTTSLATNSIASAGAPAVTGHITTLTSTTINTGTLSTTGAVNVSGRVNANRAGLGLDVANNARIRGTLTVDGNVTFANSGCPTGTARMGSWCITNNQGADSYGDAIDHCEDLTGGPFQVCPLEAMLHCDQLNFTGSNCGILTDEADPTPNGTSTSTRILTSTIHLGSVSANESSFNNATCYVANNDFQSGPVTVSDWSNAVTDCSSGEAFFCCKAAF